jgi:hypothetical protein
VVWASHHQGWSGRLHQVVGSRQPLRSLPASHLVATGLGAMMEETQVLWREDLWEFASLETPRPDPRESEE